MNELQRPLLIQGGQSAHDPKWSLEIGPQLTVPFCTMALRWAPSTAQTSKIRPVAGAGGGLATFLPRDRAALRGDFLEW
jgi:hypothetical protein